MIHHTTIHPREFQDGLYSVLIPGAPIACACGSTDVTVVYPGQEPFAREAGQPDMFAGGGEVQEAVEAVPVVAMCLDCARAAGWPGIASEAA